MTCEAKRVPLAPDEAEAIALMVCKQYLDLMHELCDLIDLAEDQKVLPAKLAMTIGRLHALRDHAPPPEEVHAWLNHMVGAEPEIDVPAAARVH